MKKIRAANELVINAVSRVERAKLNLSLAEHDLTKARADLATEVLNYSKFGPADELNAEEKAMCAANNPIQAIKNLRNRTTLGLKEAKDVVDAYRANNGARS